MSKKLIFGTAFIMIMAVTANTYAEGSTHSPKSETSKNEGWRKGESGKGEMKKGHHHHNCDHNHTKK